MFPLPSRRQFIGSVSAALAVGAVQPIAGRSAEQPQAERGAGDGERAAWGPLITFAKPLQWLSPTELADFLAAVELDGIEATVRKGGQVEPPQVREELPNLVDALARRQKRVVIMASDINDATDATSRQVLEQAAQLEIPYYRMAYYRYDYSQPILPQLERFSRAIEQLVQLNRSLGIAALYQNHAGATMFGAPLWDLHQVLADQPSDQVAVAFDIRHAVAEATSSWVAAWHLLRPHLGALYLKDFVFTDSGLQNVPLGEGRVPASYYQMLRQNPPAGGLPISVHMEYVDHRKPELIEQSKAAIAADRQTVRRLLKI